MGELLTSYGFWIVFGLLLLLSEWVLPGLVAFFFGVGALLVGLLTAAGVVQTLPAQLGLFAVLSLASLFLLRGKCQRWMRGAVGDSAEREYEDNTLIGRRAVVREEFVQGRGIVELNGSRWKADSKDQLKVGDAVWVTRTTGILLHVTSLPPAQR